MTDLSKDLESLKKGLQQARDGGLVDGPDVDMDALPDPPWLVLAHTHDCDRLAPKDAVWWALIDEPSLKDSNSEFVALGSWLAGELWWAHELTVVPHPRNDPEAVKIIEAAKEKWCA